MYINVLLQKYTNAQIILMKIELEIHILKWSIRTSVIFISFGFGAPTDKFCCIKSFAFHMVSFLDISLENDLHRNQLKGQQKQIH